MKKIQDKQIEGIIFKGGFCPFWEGGVERQCGCLLRKYMKKILNATKEGVCQAITAHYHKEGVGNIIGGGSSIILATAVIEYEDEIQNVPIPKGSK